MNEPVSTGKPQWSKFSSEVAQKVVDLVRGGSTRANAAARVGVSDRTLKLWVQKGRANLDAAEGGTAELTEHGLFVEELLRAEAELVALAEDVVHGSMKAADPALRLRAAVFVLKHRGGPDYRARVEQVGRDGESVHDGARDRLRARIEEKRAALTRTAPKDA